MPISRLAQAALVVDHALPVALRKTIATPNALVIVGLTHRLTAGENDGSGCAQFVLLRLNSATVILEVFGLHRGHSHSDA